jgi:uncharacterized membrane protein
MSSSPLGDDPTPHLPSLRSLVRDHFLAGLLVVIPLAVITWMVGAVVGTLWRLLDLLPADLQPRHFFEDPTTQEVVNTLIVLGAVVVLALGVSVLGWVSRQYLGRKVLELIGAVIQRIPLLRSVYSTLDQLLRTMAPGGGQQFSRVVYIEYPRKGLWALAFVSSPARGPAAPSGHLNVYVPTTPNPTSGFHLLVPESDVKDSQMKVEDAFKTILSLGIAQPPGGSQNGG